MAYYKKYKGKLLGPYSYDRETHHFTTQDVARISKSIVKAGRATPIEIVAVTATALGLGFLICKAAKTYRRITSLFDFLSSQAITFGLAFALNKLLQYLLQAPFLKLPVINKVAYALIAIIALVLKIFDSVMHFKDDLAFINDTTTLLESGCDFVKHYATTTAVFDDIGDIFDDVKDNANDFDFTFDTGDLLDKLNEVSDLIPDA
jgi:hypothetical protein